MRKALVIGIDAYPGSPLTGCVNDAVQIANELAKHSDGSPNFAVRLITDPSTQVTRAMLREAAGRLFEGRSEVALFYFSGHGTVNPAGGHIVTSDARRYDEGVSMDELLAFANQSQARDRVIILDCCHSGAFGSPVLAGQNVSTLGEGLTVLTACRSSEPSVETNGHGVFTSLVIDALQGGAADLRGNITPGSLYSYVDEALGAWDQRPVFKTNISRFVSLKQVEPPIALDVLRRITTHFSSPWEEHQLDPSYEPFSDSPDPEKVKVFKDLQKYESVHLVRPVGEEHMYFAAMKSKSCKLTALGYQYWRLVSENKI